MAGTSSFEDTESSGISAGSSEELTANDYSAYNSLASNSTTNYELFPDEFTFQNQQMVYMLQKHRTVNTREDAALQIFYTNNQTTSIGKFG